MPDGGTVVERRSADGASAGIAGPPAQVRRAALPHELAVARCTSVTKSTVRPLACGRRFSGRTVTSTVSPTAIGAVRGDRVRQVHGADGGERERRVGHHPQVQREAEEVRVGQRHGVLGREAADRGVRRHVLAPDRRPAARRNDAGRSRSPPPVLRMPGSRLTPGTAGSAARTEWQRRRRALDDARLDRHQAPSIIWPQTRTTLPLTAVGAGAGEPGDRLGDVDGQAALAHRVEPAADLAGGERHGRGHLGLDEARRDGVDGDAVGQLVRERVDQADDAGLGGGVVGLAEVAGDAGDRGDADDRGRWR